MADPDFNFTNDPSFWCKECVASHDTMQKRFHHPDFSINRFGSYATRKFCWQRKGLVNATFVVGRCTASLELYSKASLDQAGNVHNQFIVFIVWVPDKFIPDTENLQLMDLARQLGHDQPMGGFKATQMYHDSRHRIDTISSKERTHSVMHTKLPAALCHMSQQFGWILKYTIHHSVSTIPTSGGFGPKL